MGCAQAGPASHIRLGIGDSATIDGWRVTLVSVGDSAIVEVAPLDEPGADQSAASRWDTTVEMPSPRMGTP